MKDDPKNSTEWKCDQTERATYRERPFARLLGLCLDAKINGGVGKCVERDPEFEIS